MTTSKEAQERFAAARKAERRAEDFQMITNPDRWPAWPLLPMKRYKGSHGAPDTAVVTECEHEGRWLLFDDVILFMFPYNMRGEKVLGVARTADEILDQGWTVD